MDRVKPGHKLPKSACPFCAHELDTAAAIDDRHTPAPGDLTLCINCGEWLVFGEGMSLQKPTDEEYVEIAANPGTDLVRRAWLSVHKPQKAN